MRNTYKNYNSFLNSKRITSKDTGFAIDRNKINKKLFEFQKDLVIWSLKRGCSAIFADCGLGKTPIQLEWMKWVINYTGKPGIIFAPLAVSTNKKRR